MLAATRGLAATADDLVITRGSQMGLHLVARALVAPGDQVAVEALGYRPAWEALRGAGARLLSVPVDAGGIDVDRLRTISARRRLRAVYVTPHHQYPTTVPMSPARRLALLALAGERGFAVNRGRL
jgi:GntR family transcriptional regulator/MocR family aminotransferase